MHKVLSFLKKTFLNEKFVKFCLFGTVNTFNTAWISSVFSLFLQSNVAAVIGYLSSLSIAYILDSKFIFKWPLKSSSYFLFLLTYIPNFVIYFLVTFITINTMELPQFWGTILATVVGAPTTFALMKLFTFNKNLKKY